MLKGLGYFGLSVIKKIRKLSKIPYFPFYVQDYLIDTMRWDRPMKSLHVDLLAEFWANGMLTNENGFPKGLNKKDQKIWKKIAHKWKENDGFFYNEKLHNIQLANAKYLEIQTENGKKGGRPKRVALGKPKGSRTISYSYNNNYVIIDTTHPLVKLASELKQVSRLPEILTNEEAVKLVLAYGEHDSRDILFKMNNYKPLLKKSVTVYHTADNWLKRDREKKLSANKIQSPSHGADNN